MSKTMLIEARSGETMPGYVAEPAAPASSAVIVIQEAFGLNAEVRRRCDILAEAGRLAVAPDLYWRFGKNIELDPDIPPQMQRGLDLLAKLDEDQAVEDLRLWSAAVRSRLPASAKLGAIGFCIGGKLAYLAAARTEIDVAIGYYGVGIDTLLDEKDAAAPFMLHVGEDDRFFTRDAQARVAAAFDGRSDLLFHSYPDAGHGFASEFGLRRADATARLADERSAAFFRRWLDGE